jgi:hypothetical protein
MISIKQPYYAFAIEKTLQFKKTTAEVCNVSLSILTMAISELEKKLGVLVFSAITNKY